MSTMTTTYEREVEASLQGDRDAFARIVEAHQSAVRAITFSLTSDAALSDDLAQETFLTAWQRLSRLRNPRLLSAWLYGIARNLAREALRKRKRDPLHRAAELDAGAIMSAVADRPDSTQQEREAVAWEALRMLPDGYRETVVLHYREDLPAAAIAQVLGVSEDCVRQRLSRGRKMLRESVAALLEDTLGKSRVHTSLVPAILIALPMTAAPASLTAGVAAGSASAKGAGALASGGPLALALVTLIGPAIGMTGGFFGMWKSIQNAQTLRVRRYTLKFCALTYTFVWLMLGFQSVSGHLLWSTPLSMAIVSAAGWIVYLPLLVGMIVMGNARIRRLLDEDTGVRSAPVTPLELSGLSIHCVWICFAWCAPLALAGSAGFVIWLARIPYVPAWPVVAFVLLSHLAFTVLYTRGVSLAWDDVAFAESAPINAGSATPDKTAHVPSARSRFWNHTGALCGAVLGGSTWLVVTLFAAGRPLLALTLLGIAVAVLSIGIWRFRVAPSSSIRVLSISLFVMGAIEAILMLLDPAAINRAVFQGHADGMVWLSQGAAAVVFGIHAAIAIGLFLAGKTASPASGGETSKNQ
jgi:RNA polymerase sigma factor (sigma-70 family)